MTGHLEAGETAPPGNLPEDRVAESAPNLIPVGMLR